ncbi:PIN domain-containing protein [Mycena floridula]|nr:PIN domain-containing protein [Mycena floridula]
MANDFDTLHTTISNIEKLADERKDVEMKPPSLGRIYLVIDTNVFLSHLETLEQFLNTTERLSLDVIFIVPGIVVRELDGLKNRTGQQGFFSRRSSLCIKVQVNSETCDSSGSWRRIIDNDDNDGLIVDCCQYFTRRYPNQVGLVSADNNLCIRCASLSLPVLSPSGPQWSSRRLAQDIYGSAVDLAEFPNTRIQYSANSQIKSEETTIDRMDVDQDESISRIDARSSLHLQVVQHFTSLLMELVGQVGGPEIQGNNGKDSLAASKYAPQWRRGGKPYTSWDSSELLEYLDGKRRIKPTEPSLERFLRPPYKEGSRRGQDWSTMDWLVVLNALKELGDNWNEPAIQESLVSLEPHLEFVFAQPMQIGCKYPSRR